MSQPDTGSQPLDCRGCVENFADRVSNPSGIIDALAMQGYLALVRARDAPKTVLGEASQFVTGLSRSCGQSRS
jgi:hypothetical protein